ncbi:MAG: hypothetical protein AAFP86_10105 [Planctomycetota bacterium]
MFTFQETVPGVAEAIERECARWEGTPYRPNHQTPQVGADCRSFAFAVYDKLRGEKTDVATLPPDIALHQPETARAFLRTLRTTFDAHKVQDDTLEPGDALVTALPLAGPTHILIAGKAPWFWHCTNRVGVQRIGLDMGGLVYHGHYRMRGRESWAVA